MNERASAFAYVAPDNEGRFSNQDWGLFCAVSAIWGASFLFIKIGLEAFEPGLITLLRVGLGAITLRVLAPKVSVDRADWPRLVLVSVLWVALPFTAFPLAEQHINSAVTGLLNGGTPIFVALVATFLSRNRTRGAQLAGVATGFVGVVLISIPSVGEGSNAALGVALVIGATICYGFAINLAAPLQATYGSVPLMSMVLGIATFFTLPFGLWGLGGSSFGAAPMVSVTVLGVVGTGLAFGAMARLIGRVGATRASFITYLVPVVSLMLGVWFQDDHVSAVALGGVVLVISGALLASRSSGAAVARTRSG